MLQQDEMETELEEILKRDDDLETYLVRVGRLLENEKRGRKSPSAVSNRVSTSVQSVVEDKRVKLPRLEIQKFDGNVLNWSTFWDRFTSSIDDATGINEVEKFNYLLGLLNENAKSCISGLTLSSENYQHAKAILKERHAKPQVIISAHMESLVKMPSIRNMHNISQIRKMYDHITTTVRNLKTLNINPASYGALLIPVLTEKIPSDLRLIIARKFDNDIWDLETMLECFKSELHAKEKKMSITIYLLRLLSARRQRVCVFIVREVHSPSKCAKVTDVNARRSLLRKYARCFISLKQGHVSKNCKSSYKCFKCQNRHHISICEDDNKNGDQTIITFTDVNNNILLQTAKGKVSCVGINKYCDVRILFDSGSQRSYLTDDLRKRLNLRTIRSENLVVQTFANTLKSAWKKLYT